MLGYKSQSWALLDSDQDIVCSLCGQVVPPGIMALSHVESRAHVFCCFLPNCIVNHPLNADADSIKIQDIATGIIIKKTFIVKKYGLEYWNRNKWIPMGYENFEESYKVV